MRIVFAGTPEPALPSLRRLIESPRHDVVAVLTRPDAASGRRAKPSPSPVARLALEHGIPVLRPARPNSDEFIAELTQLAPDCCAVVAYGALLSERLLAVPTHGWVNLHFSLLPAWRGAAPVQAAIAAGDAVTGATTFQIEPALDSGPVYGVVTETIRSTDTAGVLLERLAVSGAALLETTLDGIADGSLTAVPQPADGVTVAPKITVEEARVRWDLPAHVVDRRIRAVTPNPGAWTLIGDLRVKVGPVTVEDTPDSLAPGAIRVERKAVYVGTGSQPVLLGQIQPPGKKMMNADRLGARRPPRRDAQQPNDRAPQQTPAAPQTARSRPPSGVRRVARGIGAGRLRQPRAARAAARTRNHRPRRRVRHRTRPTAPAAPAACSTRSSARPPDRPPEKINPVLLDLLRLGAYQLLRTRVEHARRGVHHRRAGGYRIRFSASRFRQRRAPHHRRARRAVLGR